MSHRGFHRPAGDLANCKAVPEMRGLAPPSVRPSIRGMAAPPAVPAAVGVPGGPRALALPVGAGQGPAATDGLTSSCRQPREPSPRSCSGSAKLGRGQPVEGRRWQGTQPRHCHSTKAMPGPTKMLSACPSHRGTGATYHGLHLERDPARAGLMTDGAGGVSGAAPRAP